jgi:predicted acylesterase/phospholipase RssA
MAKFAILSINGGGVFGACYARFLSRLAANSDISWFVQDTNLFAGTSVGGIIALALAAGQTPAQVDAMFGNASAMFTREAWRFADAGLLRSKFDNVGRTAVLTQILGGLALGDLPNLVAVNAFNQIGKPIWAEQTLHNVPSTPSAAYPDFRSMSAVEAGVATSAAPTYFPAINGRIDGGIAENDPSATAIIMTQDTGLEWPGGPIALGDISCLSIGVEFPGDTIDRTNSDTGVVNSLCSLLPMLLTGNSTGSIQKSGCLLRDRYFSFRPLLPKELGETAIDDYDAIPELQKWADSVDLTSLVSWIKTNW